MSSQRVAAKNDTAGAELAAMAGIKKDLYEIGEIPPLGHVPKNMYAWTIRKDREGPPETAMAVEVVPTWELDSHDVLVRKAEHRQAVAIAQIDATELAVSEGV